MHVLVLTIEWSYYVHGTNAIMGGFLFTKFFQILILKYVVWKFLKVIHRWYFVSWGWWHISSADLFLLLQVIIDSTVGNWLGDWLSLLRDLRSVLQNSVSSDGIVSWMRATLLHILFNLHSEWHFVTEVFAFGKAFLCKLVFRILCRV